MHKINRDTAQMLTDAVPSCGGLMLRCGSGEGPAGRLPLLRGCAASVRAPAKPDAERCFSLLCFFVKMKILLGFVLVSKRRY